MLTLSDAAAQIRNRQLSSVELTQQCLDRIDRLNPTLNAFITVTSELAHQQARSADAEIAAGKYRGPLHGIPIALKDLIDVAGVRTTAGSRQFVNHVPTEDADVVAQLKAAGAVIIGKTNLQEFAFGGSGLISAFGPSRNPWNPARITGGSSSGSAGAVCAGMCIAALGTDTAGSVRDPAALCGIVGHRPSEGLLSTQGIVPLRKSFDTSGPMTRTVEDAWLLLNALTGATKPRTLESDIRPLRIGLPRAGFFDDLDPHIAKYIEQALDVLRKLVTSVCELDLVVSIPWQDFDEEILKYHHSMLEKTPELYQPGTLERLRGCAAISEAEYRRALGSLSAARREAAKIFETVDVIVTPTCLVEAPEIATLQAMDDKALRAFEVQKLLHNTAPFSLLFWPSVSVPCGFTGEGLPVGLQFTAPPSRDDLALSVAHAYQQATGWHKLLPPLAS
jgi:aspartyl-tRNA(Asn)/glutamyl-tRNA(Gln) amidotransferase subunit A